MMQGNASNNPIVKIPFTKGRATTDMVTILAAEVVVLSGLAFYQLRRWNNINKVIDEVYTEAVASGMIQPIS